MMLAAVEERQAGTSGEFAGRRADENLARRGSPGDATRHMHGDPACCSVDRLELARVGAGSDHQPELAHPIVYCERASDRARRALEGGEKPVPNSVDLLAAVHDELGTGHPLVRRQKLAAGTVADPFKGAASSRRCR